MGDRAGIGQTGSWQVAGESENTFGYSQCWTDDDLHWVDRVVVFMRQRLDQVLRGNLLVYPFPGVCARGECHWWDGIRHWRRFRVHQRVA
jgi:hypothetical protein